MAGYSADARELVQHQIRDDGPLETLSSDLFDSVLSRLQEVEEIDPVALADLFALGFRPTPEGHSVLAALRLFLARRTLAHACAMSRFYGDDPVYRRNLEMTSEREPDLTALPVLDRDTVRGHFDDMVCEGLRLRCVVHSSGTTGAPIEIYKSFEEVDFLGRFFVQLFRPAFETDVRPISLSFPTPHHGTPVPIPSPALGLASGVTDDTLIQDALRVLQKTYSIPKHDSRVSVLSGMGFQVLFFTNYLLEQGIDPAAFHLKAINVAGGFVPGHWRRFLERAWGAIVNDRYSLTETVGGATRCRCCDLFLPDPTVLFEVLDVDTGEQLKSGIGKLCVTNLFPFAQMTPLIRYDTGDLVRGAICPTHKQTGFEFLGRYRNCISIETDRGRRWLLFSSKLHEILASIPDLNVYEWFSNVRQVRDRTVGSLPVMSVKVEKRPGGAMSITIRCELRYSPHTFPARVETITAEIVSGLRDCFGSALSEYLDRGDATLTVTMLAPNEMTDEYVIKV